MNKIFYLFVYLAFLSGISGFSQKYPLVTSEMQLKFRELTTNDGLSQNTITSIIQDDEGLMWFGTQNGLDRYDGYRFEIFQGQPKVNSISDSYIIKIFQKDKNIIWVSTNDGWLNKYDKKNDKWQQVYLNREVESITTHIISDIKLSQDKNYLWLAGGNSGLSKLNVNSEMVETFPQFVGTNTIVEDENRNIWIGTKTGLKIMILLGKEVIENSNVLIPQDIKNKTITFLFEDKNKSIWIGTNEGKVYCHNMGNWKTFCHDKLKSYINQIVEVDSRKFWIGTNDGLFFCDTKRLFSINELSSFQYKLTNNSIKSLFLDQSNILWIGTGTGLNKLDLKEKKFLHIFNYESDGKTLMGNTVWSIYVDSSFRIFVGSEESGLSCYNIISRKWTYFPLNGEQNYFVKSIVPYSKFILLVGTNKGIYFFNIQMNKFFKLEFDGEESFIGDQIVKVMIIDREKKLLIGNETGLFEFSKRISYGKSHSHLKLKRILHQRVSAILETGKDVYVGTDDNGVFQLLDKQFVRISILDSIFKIIHCKNVRCLAYDEKSNNLLIGTKSGLFLFNKQLQKIVHYTVKDGLPSNVIYTLVIDKAGRYWISTLNGISFYSPKANSFANYSVQDGLQANEFNSSASFEFPLTNEIFMGGINGLTAFIPDSIKLYNYKPRIFLDKINILNGNGILKKQDEIPIGGIYKMGDDETSFEIELSSLHFASSKKIKYEYMVSFEINYKSWYETIYYTLHGKPKAQWIPITTIPPKIRLTNLIPGYYSISIRYTDSDGIIEKAITNSNIFTVKIDPPGRKRWLFLIGTLLILASISFLISFFVYLNRKRALELNLAIDSVKIRSKIMDEVLGYLAHQWRQPINNISLGVQLIQMQYFEGLLKADEFDSQIRSIIKNTNELSSTIHDFGTFFNPIDDKPDKVYLKDLANHIYHFVWDSFHYNGIQLSLDVPEQSNPIYYGYSQILYQVLLIVINNAKEAIMENKPKQGLVQFRITEDNNYFSFKIVDNGGGIEAKIISKIFDPYFTTKKYKKNSGLGLYIAKTLVEKKLNGSIVLTNIAEGCEVLIKLLKHE